MQHKSYFSLLLQYCSDSVLLTLPSPARWSITLSTGPWSSGELGRGKSEKACRHTFGAAVPRHPLCIRFWCKLLLAKTLTVDRSDWHRLFGQHVARDLITKWQKQKSPRTVHKAYSKAITKGGTTRSSQKTHTIFGKTLSFGLSCTSVL